MTRLPPLWLAGTQTLGVIALCGTLFLLVRRGRWIKWNHPVCARCGFNLYGLPETSDRCPECGEELAKVRKMGVWRRRWTSLALAAVLLVAGLWVSWAHIWAERVNELNPYVPTPILLWEAGTRRYGYWAMAEVTRRARDGQLSDRQWTAAVDRAIALGALWGGWVGGDARDLILDGRAAGKVSDAQWSKYVGQVAVVYPTRCRLTVARGDPLVITSYGGTRLDLTGNNLVMRVRVGVQTADGVVLRDPTASPPVAEFPLKQRDGHPLRVDAPLPDEVATRLGPGLQRITITTDVDVLDANRPGVVISHQRRTENAAIKLLPPGQPSVKLVDPTTQPPGDVEYFKSQFTPTAVWLDGRPPQLAGGALDASPGPYNAAIPGVGIAYRVFVRDATHGEQLLGELVLEGDQPWHPAPAPPTITGDRVTVVLKPAPDLAARTIGMDQLLAGDLTTPDVPVKR